MADSLVDPDLIAVLRCPESRQPLHLADPAELALIAAATQSATPPDSALVRQDGALAYPIRDGFPILLLDEAISLPSRAPVAPPPPPGAPQ